MRMLAFAAAAAAAMAFSAPAFTTPALAQADVKVKVNSGEHGGFSCEVFGSEGYIRAGIYIPPFAKDKKGDAIDLSKHNMPEDASVFTVAYDQIAAHLDGGPLPECTDKDWHVVNEVGYAGIESALTRQRITLPNVNRTRKVHANG